MEGKYCQEPNLMSSIAEHQMTIIIYSIQSSRTIFSLRFYDLDSSDLDYNI